MESSSYQKVEQELLQRGVDISAYKEEFVESRIDRLAGNIDSLIINETTTFFRDKEVFEFLKSHLEKKDKKKRFRVLDIGCSSGEEVYSLAFILEDLKMDYQIFAIDIDEDSINKANRGVYHKNEVKNIGEEYLQYFSSKDSLFFVDKNIKSKVTFFKESAFSIDKYKNIDFVVCRNFLIYLKSANQDEVIAHICSTLKSEGELLLGLSEYPPKTGELFTPIDYSKRVFKKITI